MKNRGRADQYQYYEMLSPQDTETTRDECKRVLTYLGAVVQIEDSEGWGNLKVHSNEIRGKPPTVKTRFGLSADRI